MRNGKTNIRTTLFLPFSQASRLYSKLFCPHKQCKVWGSSSRYVAVSLSLPLFFFTHFLCFSVGFSQVELLQECLSALPWVTLGCQAQLCPAEGLSELTGQPLAPPTQPVPTAPQLPTLGQHISLCASQHSGTFVRIRSK